MVHNTGIPRNVTTSLPKAVTKMLWYITVMYLDLQVWDDGGVCKMLGCVASLWTTLFF